MMRFRDFFRRGRGDNLRTYATPAEGDQLILDHLREAGADLTQPREVLQYLYFPTEAAAHEAAEAVRAYGYDVEVRPSATDDARNPWLTLATAELVVDEGWVAAMRPQLEAIASLGGGEYDGWEAAAE